ncbi:hypothetical protein PLICRDRAFT_121060 [Plicaturopsis crispa FD-325 SS-3]|nr:hypothetical protein PLICRDRAFT_121060 [Plicaturopsis crispa FD-325 SS-3]
MSDAPAAPVTENGVPPAAQESAIEEAPGFKVFAGNLAYSTTDEGLKAFFAPVEKDILTAQVILRGTRSAGYGFVSLSTAEAAQKAVEALNKKELDGREVVVEVAKPPEQKDQEKKEKRAKRRPGRRGSKSVPGEVTEAEANGEAKPEGAVSGTDEAAKPKKKKKKAARKPKAKKEDGEAAEATDAAPAEGAAAGEGAKKRARKAKAPRPPRPAGEDPAGEPSKTMLFVANLGFNIEDDGLSALFTEAGINVVSARIVRRRWGQPRKSKGYGFVDVGSEEEQKKAIAALEGKEVGGRTIAVKVAVNTPQEEGEAESGEAKPEAAAAPEAACRPIQFKSDTSVHFHLTDLQLSVSPWSRSHDEDDYLSDKFLVETANPPPAPKTYAERRKEAERQARIKNEENRLKSRRQLELESREEGLSKSLFERAKEEESAGLVSGNKALSMMMKMGFTPGQALGKVEPQDAKAPSGTPEAERSGTSPEPSTSKLKHKIEPLPINEWTGKKGIGLGKRARSPTSAERVAKMAKMAESASHDTFRDRTRQEYEERRAEGRLGPAQRTCVTLDEKNGKQFNVLWLNPKDTGSFPEGLVDALSEQNYHALLVASELQRARDDVQARLRRQMQEDALQPLDDLDEPPAIPIPSVSEDKFSAETVAEVAQFLRLNAQDRLHLVLSYLRDKYAYCFWCGTQYDDVDEMEEKCPGADEDAHD